MHSGVCLRTLPGVFDLRRRRWIDPTQATAEEVMAAVAKCPSGALQSALVTAVHPAVARDRQAAAADAPRITPTGQVSITVRRNGPFVVEGAFTLRGEDQHEFKVARRCELCRCGRSRSQPFCDRSHESGPWE
jgi:hypothetical protein